MHRGLGLKILKLSNLPTVYRNLLGWWYKQNNKYVDKSAYFWPVVDRKRVLNTIKLIYRHDMSSGLQ